MSKNRLAPLGVGAPSRKSWIRHLKQYADSQKSAKCKNIKNIKTKGLFTNKMILTLADPGTCVPSAPSLSHFFRFHEVFGKNLAK